MNGRRWEEFERFSPMVKKYMYPIGEGETMASQAVTAVNKLVYKWYNDGDVFDNSYGLDGWCNDLSSYANWLWKYLDLKMLEDIFEICNEVGYEELLYEVATTVLNESYLAPLAEREKEGSVYECIGPFEFIEEEDW